MTKQQTAKEQNINGVDMRTLVTTIDAIQADPGLATFKFRLENKWVSGGHNRSTVGNFYGAKQEQAHLQAMKIEADEPVSLVGTDLAPNPVEHLLNALAACMTTGIVYHAATRGIKIEELESHLEGDLDLRGFLGIAKGVRPGFQNIRVNFKVKTDAQNLDDLLAFTQFSPVLDVTTNGTKVDVRIERK